MVNLSFVGCAVRTRDSLPNISARGFMPYACARRTLLIVILSDSEVSAVTRVKSKAKSRSFAIAQDDKSVITTAPSPSRGGLGWGWVEITPANILTTVTRARGASHKKQRPQPRALLNAANTKTQLLR